MSSRIVIAIVMVVGAAAAVSARPSEDSPLQFSETAAPAAVDKSTDPSSSAIESIITAGDGSENDPNATVDLRHHHRPYYGGYYTGAYYGYGSQRPTYSNNYYQQQQPSYNHNYHHQQQPAYNYNYAAPSSSSYHGSNSNNYQSYQSYTNYQSYTSSNQQQQQYNYQQHQPSFGGYYGGAGYGNYLGWREGQKNNGTDQATDGGVEHVAAAAAAAPSATTAEIAAVPQDTITFQ